MLTESVWAEIKIGNEHLRLFSEHNAQGVQASVYNVATRNWIAPFRAGGRYRAGQGKSSESRPSVPEGSRKFGPTAADVEGVALALVPPVVGGIKAGQRAIGSEFIRKGLGFLG